MHNQARLVVGVVAIAGIMAGTAFCGGNEPAGNTPAAPTTEKKCFKRGLAGELGLSDEKASEIKTQMFATRKEMIQLNANRDLAKTDLEHLMQADTLDEKAILQAADKLAQSNAEITKAQAKARVEIAKMLTPEQRARLIELRQGMQQRHGERQERGGEGRRGWFSGGQRQAGEHQAMQPAMRDDIEEEPVAAP